MYQPHRDLRSMLIEPGPRKQMPGSWIVTQ
jgi:hypothetical protein